MNDVFALDLDGTLVGCRSRQVAVVEAVAALEGVDGIDLDCFWSAKRNGAPTAEGLVGAGVPPAAAERVADGWLSAIEDPRWLALDQLEPTAQRALADIRAAGLEPRILTARRDEQAVRRQVRLLGLDVVMEVVAPSSARAEKAAVLGRWQAVGFVGDTESDAAAAVAADVPFAAVGSGQRSPEFLRAHEAGTVYDDVAGAVHALLEGRPAESAR